MKKFFSAFLLMTAMVLSVGTFVACNDLTDEITGVQSQASQNAAAISAIESEITALEGQIATAQKATDDAAAAAKAAQGTADEAKALAAKAATKAELEALQTAVAALEALKADVAANKTAIENVNTEIAAIKEEIAGLKTQLAALQEFKTLVETAMPEYAKTAEVEALIEEVEALIAANGVADKALEDRIAAVEEDLLVLSTALRSIVFAPEVMVNGVEAIEFASFQYAPIKAEKQNAAPADYNTSISEATYAYYHFNPSTFDLAKAEYTYVDRNVTLKSGSALVTIEGAPVKVEDEVKFTLRRDNVTKNAKANMIALEATLESGEVVRSQYVQVVDTKYNQADLFVAHTKDLKHYYLTAAEAIKATPSYQIVWDGSLDMTKNAVACLHANGTHKVWDVVKKYGFSFRYSVAKIDNFETDEQKQTFTEQQRVLSTDGNGMFTVTKNRESIGRTPIVLVEILDAAGNVVRYGYTKLQVVAQAEKNIEKTLAIADIVYNCKDTKVTIGSKKAGAGIETPFNETWFQDNLYKTLTDGYNTFGLSHEEFWAMYDFKSASVTKDGKAHTMTLPALAEGIDADGTLTNVIGWNFTHGELGSITAKGATFAGTVVLENKVVNSEYPKNISLTISFKAVLPVATLETVINEQYWNEALTEFRINANVPANTQDVAENFYFNRNINEAFVNKLDAKVKACHTEGWAIKVVAPKVAGKGISFDGTNVSLNKTDKDVQAALNDESLKVTFEYVVTFDNGDTQSVYSFDATFVKPVDFNLPSLLEVTDAIDGGDVVEFGWNGLLTDWRGAAILPAGVEYPATPVSYVWEKICTGKDTEITTTETVVRNEAIYDVELVPEHTTLYSAKTTAYRIGFELDNVTTSGLLQIVPVAARAYAALQQGDIEAAYKALEGNDFGVVLQTKEFATEYTLTKADADAALKALVDAENVKIENSLQDHWKQLLALLGNRYDIAHYNYATVQYAEKTTTKVEEVKTIVGYKEVTETVTKITIVPHECNARPAYAAAKGLVEGCWTAVEVENPVTVIPGAYWDFYGPINGPVLELDKVTTNLDYNGNKLPSGVTLVQDGTTVKYVNVGSPVRYAYEIYIPAYVEYGFGKLTGTLVIKVNPINE